MIQGYKVVSIIYGGGGRQYAEILDERIKTLSEEKRYPIRSIIINDRLFTREMLSELIALFKNSEFCVAFLTEEDQCISKGREMKRVRQNVIFELGMALIELGRERCILLSDFNTRDQDFDLPSDMSGMNIKRFDEGNMDEVIDNVIRKLLRFSQHSLVTGVDTEEIPRYNDLFCREEYRIDYENIFMDRPNTLAAEGRSFFYDTLTYWSDECGGLAHFDEKCIYLLERLGFLPIFGSIREVGDFLEKARESVENYHNSDIRYYGNTEILEFVRNLVQCVVDYTVLKTESHSGSDAERLYKDLLDDLLSEDVPEGMKINPLIQVVYYDYLGLTYLRIFRANRDKSNLQRAMDSFVRSSEYASKVDMSLQIWAGFLTYNIARVYAEMGEIQEADRYFRKAIKIRGKWLKTRNYNITVRNALSFEYFIAKIDHIDMCRKYGLLSHDEIYAEYEGVEKELNIYSDADERMDQLLSIRKKLQMRRETLTQEERQDDDQDKK